MSGNERVDVLIIGSGASGAAVAWSLAETRMRILCLEQGDWMKSTDFPTNGRDWEARRYGDFDIFPNRRGRDTDYPVNDDNSPMKVANFNGVGGGTVIYTAHVFLPLGQVRLPGAPDAIQLGLSPQRVVAILSILLLTGLNVRGVRLGATIQTVFTVAKAGALAVLVICGLTLFRQPTVAAANFADFWGTGDWTLAMVPLVGAAMVGSLFSSDAWNNVTFAAAEVQNPSRNLPMALAVGTTLTRAAAADIPLERIVLLGFSQGACLAAEFAARNARRYGGLAVLSGGLIGPALQAEAHSGNFSGMPAFLGCSDIDSHIPAERVRESGDLLQRLGANVTMRLYPGMGHMINDDELERVRAMITAARDG